MRIEENDLLSMITPFVMLRICARICSTIFAVGFAIATVLSVPFSRGSVLLYPSSMSTYRATRRDIMKHL